MRKAAIGIGSNAVRLLVADVTGGRAFCVHRGRSDARPFAGLKGGRFTDAAMERMVETVAEFQRTALSMGAERVSLVATSATRDAANADTLKARILDATGLSLRVLSGREEAALSFAGGALPGQCGMIDVGGGSTELIVGRDGVAAASMSLQLGAVRLAQGHGTDTPNQAAALLARVEAEVGAAWRGMGAVSPEAWVGVGGSCTALADVDAGTLGRAEGHSLARESAERILFALAGMSLEARRMVPGLPPERADVVVAGTAIVVACMRVLGMERLRVTKRGNLDGCLITPPEGILEWVI